MTRDVLRVARGVVVVVFRAVVGVVAVVSAARVVNTSSSFKG